MFLAEAAACVKVWRWARVLCKIGLVLSKWNQIVKVGEEGKHQNTQGLVGCGKEFGIYLNNNEEPWKSMSGCGAWVGGTRVDSGKQRAPGIPGECWDMVVAVWIWMRGQTQTWEVRRAGLRDWLTEESGSGKEKRWHEVGPCWLWGTSGTFKGRFKSANISLK